MFKRIAIVGLLGLILCIGVGVGYGVGTPEGSTRCLQWMLSTFWGWGDVVVEKQEGSLLKGLHWDGVRIGRIPNIPVGYSLEIRRVTWAGLIRQRHGLSVTVHSGWLHLPTSDPILFSGRCDRGRWQVNLYAPSLEVKDILTLFRADAAITAVSGHANHVDLNLEQDGPVWHWTGRFMLKEFRYHHLVVQEAAVVVDLRYRSHPKPSGHLEGVVQLDSGHVRLRNIRVVLEPSWIRYTGQPKRPWFEAKGRTRLEGVSIWITLKGTLQAPDLRLRSHPMFDQDYLLLMLASGKRWRGLEGVVKGDAISLDLVQDFLDHAVLGGRGSRLADRFGIRGSFSVGEGATQWGIQKTFSDRMEVRYGVEQHWPKEDQTPTVRIRHKIGADLQVTETDRVSVEAERESSLAKEDPNQKPATDQILIRYKKQF
jgi:hypothetical protein